MKFDFLGSIIRCVRSHQSLSMALGLVVIAASLTGAAELRGQVPDSAVNDRFADAIDLRGAHGTVRGSNLDANRQPDEPDHGDATLWWRWTAPQSGRALWDTMGSDFDTFLRVTSPSGEQWENDDYDGTDSRLDFELPEDGEYTITVTSFGEYEEGDYEVLVSAWAETGEGFRGRLAVGGPQLIKEGEYYATHLFRGTEGERVIVDLHSTDFDTFLVIVGPSGQRWLNDDFDGTDSRLEINLPESGEYTITVTSFGPDETGDYRVSLSRSSGVR